MLYIVLSMMSRVEATFKPLCMSESLDRVEIKGAFCEPFSIALIGIVLVGHGVCV